MKLAVLVCLVVVAAAAPGQTGSYGSYQTTTTERYPPTYQTTTNKYQTTTDKYQTTTDYYKHRDIKLLKSYSDSDNKGNYQYGYEQDNGQKVEEVGTSYPGPEPETGSISKTGSYEFTSPEGLKFHVDYTADEDGYRPSGKHLPTKPPQLKEYAQHRDEFPELYRSAPVQSHESYA